MGVDTNEVLPVDACLHDFVGACAVLAEYQQQYWCIFRFQYVRD